MRYGKKRVPGTILLRTFPVAKYLAVLLLSLSLWRLPENTWFFPEVFGDRRFMMLWVVLFLLLGYLADRKFRKGDSRDQLTFLALAVPGLLLLDIAAVAHLYLSWYNAGSPPAGNSPVLHLLLMASGCVFWIYGRVLPRLPFGNIWGLRTKQTLASEEAWRRLHQQAGKLLCPLSLLLLLIGTLML